MLRRIAVHIDSDTACESRVAAAVVLAKAHAAHIVGIHVHEPPFVHGYDETVIPSAILDIQRRQRADDRHTCEQHFSRWTAEAGTGKFWVTAEGPREEELAEQARCSDILVLSQADPQSHRSSLAPWQLETVIMTAGRPVLAIPYVGSLAPSVDRILVCWDRGRESARAIADAAPFLSKAKEIAVLMLDEQPDSRPKIRNLMGGLDLYLRAHGYADPKTLSGTSKGIGTGNAILNAASEQSSDLIVMGLYGHSRAREWILGGASRAVLSSMTVPVLFSH